MEFFADTRTQVGNNYSDDKFILADVYVDVKRDVSVRLDTRTSVQNPDASIMPPMDPGARQYRTLREFVVLADSNSKQGPEPRVSFSAGDSGFLPLYAYGHDGKLCSITDPVITEIRDANGTVFKETPEAFDEIYDQVYGYPFTAPPKDSMFTFGTWEYDVRGGANHQFFNKTFPFAVTDKVRSNKPSGDNDMIVSGKIRDLSGNPIPGEEIHVYVLGRFYKGPVPDREKIVKTDENGVFETEVPQGGKIKVRIPNSSFEKIIEANEVTKNINEVCERMVVHKRKED